uniref:Uncharacterized protein n=1 Tax=Solanum lycopersicum TaxID=4081 RepID=K4C2N8_SOLLC
MWRSKIRLIYKILLWTCMGQYISNYYIEIIFLIRKHFIFKTRHTSINFPR